MPAFAMAIYAFSLSGLLGTSALYHRVFRAKFRRGGRPRRGLHVRQREAPGERQPEEPQVPIVGGTRAWNGAAGKLLIHNRKHNQALLKFDVVQ